MKFLKSRALYAVFIAHFANNFVAYTILSWLPAYLERHLHFSLQTSGLLATMPFVAHIVVAISAGRCVCLCVFTSARV